MGLISFKRGGIDKWYKNEVKKLNQTYYSFVNTVGGSGNSDLQAANNKSRELEENLAALKVEYVERLKAIGQKPRSDF